MAIDELNTHDAAPENLTIRREDFDRITSAFSAMPYIIEHCDSVSARQIAEIFQMFCWDIFNEADAAAKRTPSGA